MNWTSVFTSIILISLPISSLWADVSRCRYKHSGFPVAHESIGNPMRDAYIKISTGTSQIWRDNKSQIKKFYQTQDEGISPPYWFITVMGESEQWGHHKAPPRGSNYLVSDNFATRLDNAYQIWKGGTARFIMITGGAVDEERPDYVEAVNGRQYLLETYGFESPDLSSHIMIDRVSLFSHTNILNTDQFYHQLGVGSSLISTNMPDNKMPLLTFRGLDSQGFYLTHQHLSTFSFRARSKTGINLGQFDRVEMQINGETIPFISHQSNSDGMEEIRYNQPIP